MTKKIVCVLGGVVLTAGMGQAQEDPMVTLDTNADGMVSYIELSAVYLDLTEADFQLIDASGDGMIDADEMAVAIEADVIPIGDG